MIPERIVVMSMKFRTRLAELREKRDISRMDIVREANLSYQTVHSWENDLLDSIAADKLYHVLKILNCTMDEFIEFVEVTEEEVTEE